MSGRSHDLIVPLSIKSIPNKWLAKLLKWLAWITGVYAFGAIVYDGPFASASVFNFALAIVWVTASVWCTNRYKSRAAPQYLALCCVAVVMIPWSFLMPSNNRDWAPEFSKTGWVEIKGDAVTFYEYRNFDYQLDGSFTERWETKTVHLSNLKHVDYFQDNFGGKVMGHPMLSFDFGVDGKVCLSIETRREKGETFSPIGGMYKMYELQYIFGSEEDIVRVRTNIRKEKVYLYRMNFTPEKSQEIFLASVKTQNDLKNKPRFYHVFRANCTTSLRNQSSPKDQENLKDWRMLANGQLDAMIDEKGWIASDGLSFSDLRNQALITPYAQQIHESKEFSALIRKGRAGFQNLAELPPQDVQPKKKL